VTIILPIFFGIFQARMLPKADKNQIYVWIDAPRDYSIEKTNEIESKISAFLLNKTKAIPKELDIVEDVTSTI
jgi:multidrug efflux pump subunit AcrB